MEKYGVMAYVAVMILVTNLVRILPVTLIRKHITNRFIRSFLYYVPYVTLAVMTFPAILDATGSAVAGGLAFAAGIVGAWFGLGLLPEALLCCIIVLLVNHLI